MKGQQMEEEGTNNWEQVREQIHEFDRGGSDRTATSWSETLEGSIKMMKT